MLKAQKEIFATLKHDERVKRGLLDRLNEVINKRTRYLLNETLMLAGKNYSIDYLPRVSFYELLLLLFTFFFNS